jgi:hypothetical protein
MKTAEAQVKAGSYRLALEAYLALYNQYRSVAAAVNAANIRHALGETQEAANFLQQVHQATGSPLAQSTLASLNRVLQDRATISSEYDDARSQSEKVAAHASTEIRRVLPAGARVWIVNNASNNVMAQAVVDNLTADFIRNGVTVVDRESAALMDAERNFQMSGNVSDDDFVTVGNAAGASIIVNINVSGTGAARRLQVRVLDIERRTPIMASDTGEAWSL